MSYAQVRAGDAGMKARPSNFTDAHSPAFAVYVGWVLRRMPPLNLDTAMEMTEETTLEDGKFKYKKLPADLFDVVVIVGALSASHIPVAVVRDLCKSAKPGGYICMTTRSNRDNLEYKGRLNAELKQMEEEGLWTCVEVTEVEDWERAVEEHEDGYVSGSVYLYKKL